MVKKIEWAQTARVRHVGKIYLLNFLIHAGRFYSKFGGMLGKFFFSVL
jgi:hypothetical protein